jgi:RecA-family ATPase
VSLYRAPKVGKSLLILEFAVAISRAETFLDYTPERRVRVLYVDFENDPRGDVRSRLQAMGYKPADLDYLDYPSFPTMAGLDSERGALELLEAVNAYRSEVVVVDTVSRAVDGEENSNDT